MDPTVGNNQSRLPTKYGHPFGCSESGRVFQTRGPIPSGSEDRPATTMHIHHGRPRHPSTRSPAIECCQLFLAQFTFLRHLSFLDPH